MVWAHGFPESAAYHAFVESPAAPIAAPCRPHLLHESGYNRHNTAFIGILSKKPWAESEDGLQAVAFAKLAHTKAKKMAALTMSIAHENQNVAMACQKMHRFVNDFLWNPAPKAKSPFGFARAMGATRACRHAAGMEANFVKLAASSMKQSLRDMGEAKEGIEKYMLGTSTITINDVDPWASRKGSRNSPISHALYSYPITSHCDDPAKPFKFETSGLPVQGGEDIPDSPPPVAEGAANARAVEMFKHSFL